MEDLLALIYLGDNSIIADRWYVLPVGYNLVSDLEVCFSSDRDLLCDEVTHCQAPRLFIKGVESEGKRFAVSHFDGD